MIEIVREDILRITWRIVDILRRENYGELKELSNHSIHNASIFQDRDSISLAVITYALSKILTIPRLQLTEFHTQVVQLFSEAQGLLEKKDVGRYRSSIHALFRLIGKMNDKLPLYIDEVITYAEIKKGSRIYAHGISMARTAELMGISEWELAEYVGKTVQRDITSKNQEERLHFTRSLFGVIEP